MNGGKILSFYKIFYCHIVVF